MPDNTGLPTLPDGPVAPLSAPSGPKTDADSVTNFFLGKGLPEQVARGIARRIGIESAGYNPLAVNSTSGATGLYQALGNRKQELLAQPSWQNPDVQLEQL